MKIQRLLFIFLSVALMLCWSAARVSAATFTLPDTGQTKCYNAAGTEIACSGTGQDGAYSLNPMSYTDNSNGTITDNVTGLMWQKEDDNTTRTWANAGIYCNNLALGGQSGWRLPTEKELMSLDDYSISYPGPTISTTYFPNTNADKYWTSASAFMTGYAWYVFFPNGIVSYIKKSNRYYSRCVHGGQSSPSFTDNGDGTVTDNRSGLMWQQGEPGSKTWAEALSYCVGLSLGGPTDWRLPNIKELESITDDTKHNPDIDTTYFPNAHASDYWSSTTNAEYANYAWAVYFYSGNVGNHLKSVSKDVRCVRNGTSASSCTYSISPASQTFTSTGGSGSVTVTASATTCAWTASESLDWVSITSGSSGKGSGTVIYLVSANTTNSTRTGNITIAGKTFTITQKK